VEKKEIIKKQGGAQGERKEIIPSFWNEHNELKNGQRTAHFTERWLFHFYRVGIPLVYPPVSFPSTVCQESQFNRLEFQQTKKVLRVRIWTSPWREQRESQMFFPLSERKMKKKKDGFFHHPTESL
jgi:hypothetical protein